MHHFRGCFLLKYLMGLSLPDILVIVAYMIASLLLGLYFTKRASKSTEEFFLSGRNLPWWLAGTSMVATTFSSDTPLYVTGLVRTKGVYENWQWWCFLIGGMLSVALFAKLWKQAGVMTDVELTEIRYSGRAASVLRGFKAIYFSMFIHTIIKAQVILAMAKILDVSLGLNKWQGIIISSAVTITYSLMSGYWGVIVTDFFQFIVAMLGAVLLCFYAVKEAGGLGSIPQAITSMHGADNHYMDFFPPLDDGLLSPAVLTFLAYMGITWWSRYSSDGGGVIVQRMVSSKSEKHAIGGTLYFNIANYALRSWPWIIVALASLVIYPEVKDHEKVYPMMMMKLLPSGIRGLMLASFFAAFMSTLSTYLNLSSAYLINDFYRRFIKKDSDERHYIKITRLSMLLLSALTAIATYYATSIVEVFKFLLAFGSGAGMVFLLRWFWWRINAWSEVSAMTASTAVSSYLYLYYPSMPFYEKLSWIISISTLIWVFVTFITKPIDTETLINFFRKNPIGGRGWKKIEALSGITNKEKLPLREALSNWLWGTLFIYSLTIAPGLFLLGRVKEGLLLLPISMLSGIVTYRGFLR